MNPVRTMRIYRRFFVMIKKGEKTIEVRVAYGGMKKIQVGDVIRFMSDSETCDRRVTRVAQYRSFAEMMDKEDHVKINPHASAADQLAEIRKIFPPDKERIGVIVFEFENV